MPMSINQPRTQAILCQPGEGHTTESVARALLLASPAGLESYFQEIEELIKREPVWPPWDMTELFDLMARYDTFPATDPEAE